MSWPSLLGRAGACLVTPRWDEPYGLVAAEALACGTPVCGFARGALPELLDDRCAVLVEPDDVEALAAALLAAARLSPCRGSRACRDALLAGPDDRRSTRTSTARSPRDRLLHPPCRAMAIWRWRGASPRGLSDRVTGLSSLARPRDWPGDWLALPRDDTGEPAIEPTARGQLHWAPLGHPGLRDRMAAIAGWIQRAAPSVIVVDVSVEVAALARLMGVPVVSVVLPGQRDDPAHRLGHTLAETLIGPWPAFLSADLLGDDPVAARIRAVGAFSRFDGARLTAEPRPARSLGARAAGKRRIGGDRRPAPRSRCGHAGWEWTVLGGAAGSWLADPWPLLCQADVVVTHGGLNAVAEVAAARKPAVVVPQVRPHGEQERPAARWTGRPRRRRRPVAARQQLACCPARGP